MLRPLACASLLLAAPSFAQSVTQSETAWPPLDSPMLERVLVTGEQPGPGLWRLSKDDKTLWILGSYAPLPKKMTWRSREVESIIAESQRVIRWPRIDTDVDVGFFAGLAALPALINVGDNPDGAKLKDVVPADAYARWEALKAKYIGRDRGVEDLRPSFAALQLRSAAVDKAGLEYSQQVWKSVERIAKKHRVKVLEPEVQVEVKIEKPRAIIKKFRKSHLADAQCFSESLARLEGEVAALIARANAWAVGDIAMLKQIPPADPGTDCAQMLQQAILKGELADELGIAELRDRTLRQLEETLDQQRTLWLSAIEREMQSNTSVLSVVPMTVLLGPQTPLAILRERGYAIDEP